ncbi:MAG: reverse transcriptase family protein [Planctomycetota bacterium]
MGLGDFLRKLFGVPDRGHPVDELATRLGMPPDELRAFEPRYREFTIPKRSGGKRAISAPDKDTKGLQRRILKRLLARLSCHRAAHGFEKGRSIVTNALPHVGRAVVVRMDIRDFFTSTSARRVRDYFRRIGWNREASDLLVKLATLDGGLPQGAPTSPRLSNLVNRRLDARLDAAARSLGGTYTRYADDLTFSFPEHDRATVNVIVNIAEKVAEEEGYTIHRRKKRHVRGRCSRQIVTGLVVNESINLPRERRRWLRAVAHRLSKGRQTTLSREQLAGWKALVSMIVRQSSGA